VLPTYITPGIAKLRSRIIMSCVLCWVKEEGVIFYFEGNLWGNMFKSHWTTWNGTVWYYRNIHILRECLLLYVF